jgi:hypothetical protein
VAIQRAVVQASGISEALGIEAAITSRVGVVAGGEKGAVAGVRAAAAGEVLARELVAVVPQVALHVGDGHVPIAPTAIWILRLRVPSA